MSVIRREMTFDRRTKEFERWEWFMNHSLNKDKYKIYQSHSISKGTSWEITFTFFGEAADIEKMQADWAGFKEQSIEK